MHFSLDKLGHTILCTSGEALLYFVLSVQIHQASRDTCLLPNKYQFICIHALSHQSVCNQGNHSVVKTTNLLLQCMLHVI